MTSGFTLLPPAPEAGVSPPPYLLCLPLTLVEGNWVPGTGKAEELLRAWGGAGYPPAGWRELGLVGAHPWGQRQSPGRGHHGNVV